MTSHLTPIRLMEYSKIFVILTTMTDVIAGARILGVFPMNGFSHFNVLNAIMETLAMAGHEITVISPFQPEPCQRNNNVTYIRASKNSTKHVFAPKFGLGQRQIPWWRFVDDIGGFIEEDCYEVITHEQIQHILAAKDKKFDLMFVDLFTMIECYLPIARQQNIPVIGIFLSDLRSQPAARVGNYLHPAATPIPWSSRSSKMTFVERLENVIDMLHLDVIFDTTMTPRFTKFCRKYFPHFNPREESRVSLLFHNNHHSLFKIPFVPMAIEIAGIHLKPSKPLPKTLEEFISGAEHGAILFSFGSNTRTGDISMETIQIFRSIFATLSQRIIWKSDQQIEGITDNILVSEWIPQQDILAHKNVLLFISHLGKSSEIEAVHTATPILAIPLFGDQFSNAAKIEELGVGKKLDIRSLTKASLLSSIQEILQDKRYAERMKTLSKTFHDRPMSPKDTVLYWTEYILKHNGANHLRTAEADMPFYQYFLLDVILFVVASSVVILCTLYTLKRIISFCSAK